MAELKFNNKDDVIKFFKTTSNEYHSKGKEVCNEYEVRGGINHSIESIETYFIDFKLDNKSGKTHTVRLTYDGKDYSMWCNAEKSDSPCNFHSGNALKSVFVATSTDLQTYKVCKHIIGACYAFDKDISYMLDDIEAAYRQENNQTETATAEPEDEFRQLKRFAFKIPVLVEGDRGSGKTYEAFAYAKSIGVEPAFVGGHAGLESIDLLGCLVPYGNNSCTVKDTEVSADKFFSGEYSMQTESSGNSGLVWKDGPIAEAFRKAQSGKKAVLIIDELLRIPQRELNILLTALSPIDDKYHIRTGRILSVEDGVAKEETLSCDTKNLFVLATTNVGGQYAVDTIDSALAERFVIVRKDTDYDKLMTVLSAKAQEKGFSEETAKNAGIFFNRMISAKEQGLVEECPTLRTLSRAFELADTEDEIIEYIFAQHLLWVSRDVYGKPDKEQVDTVKQTLYKAFN